MEAVGWRSLAVLALLGCYSPHVSGGDDGGATGPTWYVAPQGGSDEASGTSSDDPFATFAQAFANLRPGDTLVLLDGTYDQTLDVTVSGLPDASITIRAEHDGGAVLDGGGVRPACLIAGSDTAERAYLAIEGIHCMGSSAEAVRIEAAHDVTVARVTAEGKGPTATIFGIVASNRIGVTDSAAWGPGTIVFGVTTSREVSLRRCYGRWSESPAMLSRVFSLVDSSASLIENSVATSAAATTTVEGFVVEVTTGIAQDNLIRGSVAHGLNGYAFALWAAGVEGATIARTALRGAVSIANLGGILQRADAELEVGGLTIAECALSPGFVADKAPLAPPVGATVFDTILAQGSTGIALTTTTGITVTHHHNDLHELVTPYQNTTMDPTELARDPLFEVVTFGRGAYLRGSGALATDGANGGPVGATLLFAGPDALWPWPLEERIAHVSGTSVTYADGGGLWTTLAGVY